MSAQNITVSVNRGDAQNAKGSAPQSSNLGEKVTSPSGVPLNVNYPSSGLDKRATDQNLNSVSPFNTISNILPFIYFFILYYLLIKCLLNSCKTNPYLRNLESKTTLKSTIRPTTRPTPRASCQATSKWCHKDCRSNKLEWCSSSSSSRQPTSWWPLWTKAPSWVRDRTRWRCKMEGQT